MGSQGKLQAGYDSFEEFEGYCEIYNIHSRLGFKTPKAAWKANPLVRLSVEPSDLEVVGEEIKKPIKIVSDFFNKVAKDLDGKYFPNVKYYRDDKNCTDVHYALELFNNGVLGYDNLIKKLSKSCGDTKQNIHSIVNKYIQDFGDFKFTSK